MKKGFTLIEVIAVIVILGIIGLIAVPVSNSIVKRSKEKLYNEQVERIIDACKKYVLENETALPDEVENQTKAVSIETIYNAGLLEGEIPNNPKTNEPMNGHIEITYSNNRYTYRYAELEYLYFATKYADAPTSVNDENVLTTKPKQKITYVRYTKLGSALTDPYICTFTNDKELCLNNANLLDAKQQIIDFFGQRYNESTDRYESINGDSTTGCARDPYGAFYCYNSDVYANVYVSESNSHGILMCNTLRDENGICCDMEKDGRVFCN